MRRCGRASAGARPRLARRVGADPDRRDGALARARLDREAADAGLVLVELGRRPVVQLPEGRVRLDGLARLPLDARAVLECCLVDGIHDALLPNTGREDERRPRPGAHDDVLGPRRAEDEVPLAKGTLLTLGDQDALAVEHEECLLAGLPVVHRHRLARGQDVEVDAELFEAGALAPLSLEAAVRTELVVLPAGIARVEEEPALALRHAALELCLGNHA